MSFDRAFARAVHIAGLVGALYEVFIDRLDRPALLALLGAMMGLADKLSKGNGK